jgi:hypothetical protein
VFFSITGIGIAAGAAWLVVELAKTHPNAAKFVVGVANEGANEAADKFSNHSDDKPAIEAIKKGKDVLAELAKHELDECHARNRGWR